MMNDLDHYAVLMYVDPAYGAKAEYWITYAGHAHSQPLTSLPVGTLGHRHHGHNFSAA